MRQKKSRRQKPHQQKAEERAEEVIPKVSRHHHQNTKSRSFSELPKPPKAKHP